MNFYSRAAWWRPGGKPLIEVDSEHSDVIDLPSGIARGWVRVRWWDDLQKLAAQGPDRSTCQRAARECAEEWGVVPSTWAAEWPGNYREW